MLRNSIQNYGVISKVLHWLTSFLITIMVLLGFFMFDFDKPLKNILIFLHKSTGIIILILVIFRISWALINLKPRLPADTPRWELFAEKFVHYSLYLLLLLIPISGWIMSSAAGYHPTLYGLIDLPLPGISIDKGLSKAFSKIHTLSVWVLLALLLLHILAALKHHFINKDNVLIRMMPGAKQ